MPRAAVSAGILLHRRHADTTEVLLVLPGGPFWRGRDLGAWQIPKGTIEAGEAPLAAARREFEEETGMRPDGAFEPLGLIRQSGGKLVEAFALEGDLDAAAVVSNRFELEWPPRSGTMRSFPEVARAGWFTLAAAQVRMLPSQAPLLGRLEALIAAR